MTGFSSRKYKEWEEGHLQVTDEHWWNEFFLLY